MPDDATLRGRETGDRERVEDSELLRRYVDEKSEEAFAELVRRHLNLVYSVALRQVAGETHLAEDVAQDVFTALARKAAALAGRPALSGWLYRSAHFAASDVVRVERRRRAREQKISAMNPLTTDSSLPADWNQLRPILDSVIAELDERDREAVALRFFDGDSFADVGVKLRLTENAARMRVERALDKLHAALARRGVTSTAAAVGLALANQAAVATFMSMTKLKVGVAAVALAIGAASIVVQRQAIARLQDETGALREQNRELTRLRAENDRLAQARSDDSAELASLRAEISAAKSQPPAIAPAPAAGSNVTGKPALATGLKPAAGFARGDSSTAKAALESLYTAVNEGDFAAIKDLIELAPADCAKAEAMFAQLPDAKRAEFGTAEQMVAMLGAGSMQVAGMQVLWDRPGARREFMDPALTDDPGYKTLHVQRQYPDGRVREEDMVFQETPAGWRWILH